MPIESLVSHRLGCLAHGPVQRHKPLHRPGRPQPTHAICWAAAQAYRWQLRKRQRRCQAAADFSAPMPRAPIPGDTQGALIHQLLLEHSDDAEVYVREGLQEALDDLGK